MKPYRTLVFAHLVQDSALSVGGNNPHGFANLPLARDGLGRPILRGSTLAGCFIAQARALFPKLPSAITLETPTGKGDQKATASAWRFAHAHLLQMHAQTVFFQHVSIDRRTLAARENCLFSIEALPEGTSWDFLLEIAPSDECDFAQLEGMAAEVLATWSKKGGARIGRGSRHGYGWAHLEKIAIVRLDSRHVRLWPNAFATGQRGEALRQFFQDNNIPLLDLDSFLRTTQPVSKQAPRGYVVFSGTIEVGERADDFGKGYGLDTLSIGGHARLQLQANEFFNRVIPPIPPSEIHFKKEEEIHFKKEDFDPDFVITAMPTPGGGLVPYIPAASIRGVWRAGLERYCQALQEGNAGKELVEKLFGTTQQAGSLSISDGILDNEDWKLLWQQQLSIDEFSGGVYGASKFDRLCIAHGRFRWRAEITAAKQQEAEKLADPLVKMLQCLGDGHLPLGGGSWRGHGHIRWTLDRDEDSTNTRIIPKTP
ncbi:RAMP superfamily CRISPR-associated protein [Candidatus Methylacidiphilum infernorum]|nr:RAMP superfamily CRISPR-associated protein [Candidatus Methylacidiphilum infernorum]